MTAKILLVAAGAAAGRARQLQAALDAVVVDAAPDDEDATVVWAAPWLRRTPLPVAGRGVQVLDLHGAVAACPGWGAAQMGWCAEVARLCRGASLLLAGSEAELGFWSVLLAEADVSAPPVVVPYAASKLERDAAAGLRITGAVADPALRPMLDAALAWAREAGVPASAAASTRAGDRLAAAAVLPAARKSDAGRGDASMLLDLRRDTPAERAATPVAVIDALAAGIPVLSTVNGPLSQAIAAAGAGRLLTGSFEPLTDAGAAAKAAAFARARFDPAAAAAALSAALSRAGATRGTARAAWGGGRRPPTPLGPSPGPSSGLSSGPPAGRRGHVLVLSEESPNLGSVRVQLPFGALHRRGAIGGYAVLRGGEIAFDTRPGGAAAFDAIWVHRSMDPGHRLLLELLRRPYAYDVDDNLLAAPSYRDAFHRSARDTAQDLLQGAVVVSCATPRLAGLLSARARVRLADRLVVTPNLGQEQPPAREPGVPRAVVWASSDRPALTGARAAVVRAVRDHCLAHRTRLVCIGAPPPDELAGSGVEVDALGLLPHAAYREHLRGLSPAILVCPLQTGADADTQDFIDGKSDIKAIEALSYGLVGVFSRAAPYLDSDLPGAILCDNTYEDWLAGLEAARAACLAPGPAARWPEARDSAGFGLAPWAAALARARLAAPLTLADLRAALDRVAAEEARHLARDEFDEAYYLSNYDDIRQAVADGVVGSGYDHYAQSGRGEGRHARRLRTPEALGEAWWNGLLHEIGRMEAGAALRTERIAALERRIAMRRLLAGP